MYFTLHTERASHPKPTVFLDRDGTINVEKNHLYRIQDWQWITGAEEAIKQLNEAGFHTVVVSNQAGIARGFYTKDEVNKLHAYVSADLESKGGKIDAYYFCPHHPNYGERCICDCRKPGTKMLMAAAVTLNIDLRNSWMVGDKIIDIQAANGAGVHGILVQTGYGKDLLPQATTGLNVVKNLPAAVSLILQTNGK